MYVSVHTLECNHPSPDPPPPLSDPPPPLPDPPPPPPLPDPPPPLPDLPPPLPVPPPPLLDPLPLCQTLLPFRFHDHQGSRLRTSCWVGGVPLNFTRAS